MGTYFRSNATEGQRSYSGQVALEMPYGHKIWYEEPLSEEQCIAEVKGHTGSTRGEIVQECLMATTFGRKKP